MFGLTDMQIMVIWGTVALAGIFLVNVWCEDKYLAGQLSFAALLWPVCAFFIVLVVGYGSLLLPFVLAYSGGRKFRAWAKK